MKYGAASQQYTLNMIDAYGRDFVDMLVYQNKVVKYSKFELEIMLKELKDKIKEHEKRVGAK